jgi:signal transduction histidine kinase
MPGLTLERSLVIETLLSSIGLGIVVADHTGKVLLFNNAATTILGPRVNQTAPKDWPKQYGIYLVDGQHLCPEEQSPLVRAISGEEADNVEVLIVSPGKSIRDRWCVINLRPLKNASGEIEGGVVVIQDITDRKRLADEAARSNEALQQFASVAAHDLQEPIRTVAGFVDMLAEQQGDNLDEKSARYIGKIKGGVKRMQSLINDLLAYSRIQSKPQKLAVTNCNEIVEACVLSLQASIRDSGASIRFEALPTVWADASQLSQLFGNLLANALKFTAPDRPPVVNISAKKQGLFWLFSVEDNGIGIAKEFAEKIFLVFQRLHTAATYPGTGIGLAICKKIVERHGGTIWFESEPGKGTTFFFTIRVPLGG